MSEDFTAHVILVVVGDEGTDDFDLVPGREVEAPGYSFRYIGGNATAVIVPRAALFSGNR